MRALGLTCTAASALALAAGCGSSSSGGWEVVGQVKVSGKQEGIVQARIGRPSILELKIDSNPKVTTQTSWSILCSNELTDDTPTTHRQRRGPKGSTPLTVSIPIPEGEPSPCIVAALATKSAPSEMTLTLRWNPE